MTEIINVILDLTDGSTIGCHTKDEPRHGNGISRLVISAPAGLVLPTRGRIDPGEVRRSVSSKLQMVGRVVSRCHFSNLPANFSTVLVSDALPVGALSRDGAVLVIGVLLYCATR